MRRALLLYNPAAGRGEAARSSVIDRMKRALEQRGLAVETAATIGPGSAGKQAAEACANGVDIVFACGGDGTICEVLQGMIGQPNATLGVLPMGSANAFARHLGLFRDPVEAVLQQLQFQPQLVPAGQIFYQGPEGERSRYFLVMAGAGADGMLVYRMLTGGKRRLGRTIYYLRAATLFLQRRFTAFTVECSLVSNEKTTLRVASAMAVRVGDLGGLFGPLVRGAELHHPHLRLTLAKAPGRISLPAWFAMSWARLHRWNVYVETVAATGFTSSAGEDAPVQVQADGEWLGQTPMRVELVPNAVRLLLPLHRGRNSNS